jgi:hypothetical protein
MNNLHEVSVDSKDGSGVLSVSNEHEGDSEENSEVGKGNCTFLRDPILRFSSKVPSNCVTDIECQNHE